jgi:fibronectin type 3 domain-containing protein
LPLVILAILFFGVVGAMLFRVGADDGAPSVLLKWNPPAPGTGSTVVSYRVYRTQPDRTYLPIVSVKEATYVDRAVNPGSTYGYYVNSVDASGRESRPSNYVSVTVP